jgi:hypothetical protein
MAARLCSNAAAGQVLVSEAIEARVRGIDNVVLEDRGTTTLKGFDGPTPFFEVLALPPGAMVVGPIDGRPGLGVLEPSSEMPLVGRGHEMRWGRGTWQQIRRGSGRVVCVSTVQIGKTRLAAEIASCRGLWGSVRYAGAGGTALADGRAAVDAAAGADGPTLVILDDDAAGPSCRGGDRRAGIDRQSSRVVLLLARRDGLPPLGALWRVDVRGDGHRPLLPLTRRRPRSVGPTRATTRSWPHSRLSSLLGGVPDESMVVSGWAREEAPGAAARRRVVVAGRTRRANDLEFANNVLGLKLDQLFRIPDAASVEVVEVCPYKGLATFREEDAALFFGRERLVGDLAARSVDVGLLGVIGASGSGKSSVVAAGLRPSLAAGLLPGSERWEQISLRPGEHPMAELRAALGPRAGFGDVQDPITDAVARLPEETRLVLVVDQFEEAFTTCSDVGERDAFVDALTRSALAGPIGRGGRILRADFYGQCATLPGASRRFSARTTYWSVR